MQIIIESRNSRQLRSQLFYVLISALVILVLWIASSVYHSYQNPETNQPDISGLLTPINPILNRDFVSNFSSSRISPPETFTVLGKQGTDAQNSTIVEINPF